MFSNFNHLVRGYTLPMSITPFLVALFCAVNSPLFIDNQFLLNSFLVLLGIILAHSAVNLFDDYIDIKSRVKNGENLADIKFHNKRKAYAILNGAFSVKSAELILVALTVSAILCGIYLAHFRGGLIYFYMLLAGLLGAFYPVSSRFGLAELTVGIVFGPLLINGSYFAITGWFDKTVFLISIASGIMAVILLITHSIMDFEHDINKDKKTLPVMLKDKRTCINTTAYLIITAYLITIYSGIKGNMGSAILFPIICTIPVSFKLISSLYEYIELKNVPFVPKWYMGRMENWEKIKKEGLGYFMFRFYLARNLAEIFHISLAIACLFAFKPEMSFIQEYYRLIF